jgi:hypothetical protein
VGLLPNEMHISCGLSCLRPHKPTFRSVPRGRCARTELGTTSARRLHVRVRRHCARKFRTALLRRS